jgi:hypothetical protein
MASPPSPWRYQDTGDGRHGQVLVLAWGEANAHGNAYHGWSADSKLAAAGLRPILEMATRP